MNGPETIGQGWLARQPVARKAAIAAAVPMLFGIAVLIATQIAMLRGTVLDEALRANRVTAELMADQMTGGMKWAKHDVVNGVIERVTGGSGSTVAHVMVLDRRGTTVALYPAGETEPEVTAVLAKLGDGTATIAEATGEHVLVAAPIGEFGRLAVAWDLANVTAGARRTMWLAFGIGVVVAALVATVVLLVLRRSVIAPVGALTDLLDHLARGEDGHATDLLGRGDEIGRMATAAERLRRVGIEAREAERDASQRRQSSETERAAAEALREQASEAQQAVVGLVARALERLAAGDLTHRVVETFPEGYGKLRDDLNTAFEALETALSRITDNAEAVRAAATDIASASDDLSRRTESQAASLEQTAAAIEEITATTRSTADNASRAREVVARAKAEAESGGDVVRQAIGAMSNIETSSEKIGQIIGLIDEISFQTNLLALNAGVEAARAGEAGRGFAVVASEVRALAQRSADAAKEIKGLIMSSKQEVEKGVELVGGTGEALERIIARVAEINGAVGEIATSASEQATGLQEVNGAVTQMDQITQQNAAMVEKATIAVRALSQQTDEFARLVGRFEVNRHGGRRTAHTQAPTPAPVAPRPAIVAAPQPPARPAPAPMAEPRAAHAKPPAHAAPHREAAHAPPRAEVHKLRTAAKPAALPGAARPKPRSGATVTAHPAAPKAPKVAAVAQSPRPAAAVHAPAPPSPTPQPALRLDDAPRPRRAAAGGAQAAAPRPDNGGWEEF